MDFEKLTIDTLMVLEDNGVTVGDLAELENFDPAKGMPPARVMAAMAFLAARTTDPAATWEDARAYTFSDLMNILTADEPADSPEG